MAFSYGPSADRFLPRNNNMGSVSGANHPHHPGGGFPSDNPLSRLAATAAVAAEPPFPVLLHDLLSRCNDRVIRWQNNGKSFTILDGDAFEKRVLPSLYPDATIETFGRLLGLYGFQRIEHGPFEGDYFHEMFQRDRPDWACHMEKVGGSKSDVVLQEILSPASAAFNSVRFYMQRIPSLPARLHYFLSKGVYDLRMEHILSWKIDGMAFVVYNTNDFEKSGLADLLGCPGYSSFRSQLIHQYGFAIDNRIPSRTVDTFFHSHFTRDRPEMSSDIQKVDQSPEDSDASQATSGDSSVASGQQGPDKKPTAASTNKKSPPHPPTKLAAINNKSINALAKAKRSSKPRKRCRLAGEPMPKNYFPFKLHTVITLCEKLGYQNIVAWQPHGRCFLIHNQSEFISQILPLFRHSEYASFRAQLKAYGFNRLGKHGPDKGGYFNEYFLKGFPELCAHIIRRPKNQHGTVRGRPKGAVTEGEPNFYEMKALPKKKDKAAERPATTTAPEGASLYDILQEELKQINPPAVTNARLPPSHQISKGRGKARGTKTAAKNKLGSNAQQQFPVAFPARLHAMLSQAQEDRLGHIISWCNDGHAFVVNDPEALVSMLLRSWFPDMSSYGDFHEELHAHGFTFDREGGYWSHGMFLQALSHLCTTIKRQASAGHKRQHSDDGDGEDDNNKARRTSSFGSPRSSATVLNAEMGNSELEVAMLLTSMDRSKKNTAAGGGGSNRASIVSSATASPPTLPAQEIVKPAATVAAAASVAPFAIAAAAANRNMPKKKPAADPPGRRWSIET